MDSNPYGVAVNPSGTKAYVTTSGSNSVYVIDTSTDTVTDKVTGLSGAYGIAFNPDGSQYYITERGTNSVSVIDSESDKVETSVPVEKDPHGVAVSPDGTKVYVANRGQDNRQLKTVSVIDASSNNVISTINVGTNPKAFGLFISSYSSATESNTGTSTNTGNSNNNNNNNYNNNNNNYNNNLDVTDIYLENNKQKAKLAFNPTPQMIFGKSKKVDAYITTNLSKNISQEYGLNGTLQSKNINATPTVRVTLTGETGAFNIETIPPNSNGIQNITNDIVYWNWQVTPLESGKHKLFLSVEYVIPLNDYDSQNYKTLKDIEEEINVKSNYDYWFSKYLWEILGAIVGIVGMISSILTILEFIRKFIQEFLNKHKKENS